jgi:ABC-type branched-subunit amino acid transport system ATPase component/branched-subunit amino acid ABC-type transport system permease component
MSSVLPYVVSGVTTGAVYGLAGTGLVVTYKTSGIFNFGHGAMATAAAYVFYWMYVDHHVDWKVAAFLAVFVLGPLMGLLMERIAKRLTPQRTAWKIVGTVGLILFVQGLGTIKYGPDSRPVPQYLPKSTEGFRLFHVRVTYDSVTIVVIAVLAVAALYALFRFTRLGVSMRAVVDDPDLLDLQGTDPVRVRRISWIIGSTFAALSGVLIVPLIGLESIALTFLVVQAFGAAALGFFSSIPLTYAGGIAIGILADVSKKQIFDWKWLAGFPDAVPFLLLFAVLLLTPRRRLLSTTANEARPHLQWQGPARLRLAVGAVVLLFFLWVPHFAGVKLSFWTVGLTQAILVLALGLLVRTAGLVSLCTATFAAIGAVAFSQMVVGHHVNWVVALVLAAIIAVPVGALVAIPSIRLSGMFLALATLGFGIMIEKMFFSRTWMFTTFNEGRKIPRPSVARSDFRYYHVVLACVVVTVILMTLIHRSRLGRVLKGLGDSPTAVSTLGLSVNVTRVIVFCISAFFAAVSGVLYGGQVAFATSADSHYTAFYSLVVLATLALAPFREPWYALFVAFTSVIPGYAKALHIGGHANEKLNVVFGFFAVLVALEGGPRPMSARLGAWFYKVTGATGDRSKRHAAVEGVVVPRREPVATDGGLAVEELTVRFGGLVAVDGVSFEAPLGSITGLIGPNGAGKTTIFNACSGLNRPRHGRVLLHGHDVSGLTPAARARLGLGRSFQIMQLCESLTVFDNVALGRESSQAGAKVVSQLAASRHDQKVRQRATIDAMELCGISHLADQQAGSLSTGERRLVELARCLAGPFDILLLDEPSSGLDREETERFAAVLTRVVAERGCGILLVEHDMSLIMNVCRHIYVVDFGRRIFDGDPTAVAASSEVQAAYLGSDSTTAHA